MGKTRLYIDTSVVSFLEAEDAPEKRKITEIFWNDVKRGVYHVYISNLLYTEIGRCVPVKRDAILSHVGKVPYVLLEENEHVVDLARKYVNAGIIPARFIDDALHLAQASLAECDAVVSWNFRHLVRLKTVLGIRALNARLGHAQIEIVTPLSLVEGE
jgi:predicted nucleic acid-binding protein